MKRHVQFSTSIPDLDKSTPKEQKMQSATALSPTSFEEAFTPIMATDMRQLPLMKRGNLLSNQFDLATLLRGTEKQVEADEDKASEQNTPTNQPKNSQFIRSLSNFDILELQVQQIVKTAEFEFTNTQHTEAVAHILHKAIHSFKEKNYLRRVITRVPLFSQHGSALFRSATTMDYLYKELSHRFVQERQTLYNYGDKGNYFYIILTGKAYVLAPNAQTIADFARKQSNQSQKIANLWNTSFFRRAFVENNQIKSVLFYPLDRWLDQEESNKKTKKTKKHYRISENIRFYKALSFLFNPSPVDYTSMSDAEYIRCKFPGFEHVQTLACGDSFGDDSLLTRVPRNTSVLCAEPTHFIRLSKAGFEKDFPATTLNTILQKSQLRTYEKGNIVYEEGDLANKIYFIHSGEIEMSRHESKLSEIVSQQRSYRLKGHTLSYDYLPVQQDLNSKKRISLCLLGAGEYFGEKEYLQSGAHGTRTMQAKCNSHSAEVIEIDSQTLVKYLEFQGKMQAFVQEASVKHAWEADHTANIFQTKQKLKLQNIFSRIQSVTTKAESNLSALQRLSESNIADQNNSILSASKIKPNRFFNDTQQNIVDKFDNQTKITQSGAIDLNQSSSNVQNSYYLSHISTRLGAVHKSQNNSESIRIDKCVKNHKKCLKTLNRSSFAEMASTFFKIKDKIKQRPQEQRDFRDYFKQLRDQTHKQSPQKRISMPSLEKIIINTKTELDQTEDEGDLDTLPQYIMLKSGHNMIATESTDLHESSEKLLSPQSNKFFRSNVLKKQTQNEKKILQKQLEKLVSRNLLTHVSPTSNRTFQSKQSGQFFGSQPKLKLNQTSQNYQFDIFSNIPSLKQKRE